MFKPALLLQFVIVVLLAGCAIPLPPVAGIAGSGKVVSQEEDISGFDKVDINHAFEVDIDQGDTFAVLISVDDNLLEYLNLVKQGDTLIIGFKPGAPPTIRNATMEATITMPELTGLDLSGASKADATGFKSDEDLSVKLSGASSLRGDIEAGEAKFDLSGASTLRGDVSTGDAKFDVSGSSDVTLKGSGGNVDIDAAGASSIDLSEFSVADAKISASGSSDVTVNATGTLNADAKGASTVYYMGSPTLGNVETSGSSSIKPR